MEAWTSPLLVLILPVVVGRVPGLLLVFVFCFFLVFLVFLVFVGFLLSSCRHCRRYEHATFAERSGGGRGGGVIARTHAIFLGLSLLTGAFRYRRLERRQHRGVVAIVVIACDLCLFWGALAITFRGQSERES